MTTCRLEIFYYDNLVLILKSLVKARVFSADRLHAIPIDKWVIRGKLIGWKTNDKDFSGGQDVGLGSWPKDS